MKEWMVRQLNSMKSKRILAVAFVLGLAFTAGGYGYQVLKPAAAKAATATMAPPAPPLDDASVNAILTLDHAMENLAAHVTPAVVNVTVTARGKAQPISQNDDDDDDQGGLRRFFGPNSPFGPGFGQQMRPGPQI